ncbi:MAG TPA: A24 family peptidase [Rhizomicrobium sp.]|nr:A24 family peptidase [Rhizomicrobium sp.]
MIPVLVMLVAAPVIGSFLGAMAIRIPEGRPILWARSQCDSCGRVLTASDLVPIASFLWLKGRCRSCGAAIGAFPPAMEIAAVAIVAWSATLEAGTGIFLASCFLGWMLLLLAAIDWRVQLLPDVLTLPLMLAGLAASFLFPLGPWRDHAIGAVAGFAVLALVAWLYSRLRKREGLGLGDAKLMAALGAWVGWQGLPTTLLWGSMLGLLFAIALSLTGRRLQLTDRLPFGVFLSIGGWLVWLYGPLGFAFG